MTLSSEDVKDFFKKFILCGPAICVKWLNLKKGRIMYLVLLTIVMVILCLSLLTQTIAIPEPQCYYNDLKQLQNNHANIRNLIINSDDDKGDDSLKVKKVYLDPIEHNPITQQPDLNPNNSKFSSYAQNCPGGDCSRRVQTLLTNPATVENLTSEEKKTTLMYTLAQLSNYYLPSFNIVNLSKNNYVDYINNIHSGTIMKALYGISMTFMVIFTLYWFWHAGSTLYRRLNFLGSNEHKYRPVYITFIIIVILLSIILGIVYYTKDLNKTESDQAKTDGNFILNNQLDYQKYFDQSIVGFSLTLIFTCGFYWLQRLKNYKGTPESIMDWIKGPSWFILYLLSLLTTSGFLIFFVIVLTILCPQLSILIMIVQRFLLSKIYRDREETDKSKNPFWNGWSIPLLPFLVLLIPMEQDQVNQHIEIMNIPIRKSEKN
jgi:hypothetical protein